MALSYEFSIGSVRAKEKSLLSNSDIEQLVVLKNEEELMRTLKDKGFGDGTTVDAVIADNTEKMWHYINSVAPDSSVFEPFYLKNDIHNLKTTLKGIMTDREFSNMLLSPCTIRPDILKKAVENAKFDLLPEWLSKAAAEAYKILAQSKDARFSDAVIDKAALEKMLCEGKNSKSAFLDEYFRIYVFYSNIKIAIRAARTKTTVDYLKTALCDCEGFDKQKVISCTLTGSENLLKYLSSVHAYDCNKAIERYKQNPTEFEKFVENKLIALARKLCRLTTEGPEPLLGYYIGCEYERQAVHMIRSGIVTRTPPDKIRERLRDLYG